MLGLLVFLKHSAPEKLLFIPPLFLLCLLPFSLAYEAFWLVLVCRISQSRYHHCGC